jgi:hypothetical protein
MDTTICHHPVTRRTRHSDQTVWTRERVTVPWSCQVRGAGWLEIEHLDTGMLEATMPTQQMIWGDQTTRRTEG